MFLVTGASAANIATTLGSTIIGNITEGKEMWIFVCTQSCWIAQGANPTATVGAGSTLVNPNFPVLIDATFGAKLSVIEDTTAGHASLTRVLLVNR